MNILYIVAILSCFLHILCATAATVFFIITLQLKSFELCFIDNAYLFFFHTKSCALIASWSTQLYHIANEDADISWCFH